MPSEILRSPFSFLFQRLLREQLVAEYLIREHHHGRGLGDIACDAYVVNRVSRDQLGRVLERPDVLHAFRSDLDAFRDEMERRQG